jgi:geranylgeranyl diphosphate synthase type II
LESGARLERYLEQVVTDAAGSGGAPGLASAVRHAVFPGGARVRPLLCLAVAEACGAPQSPGALAAAGAIELLHCASLVHDDLPCFDDASTRRGLPSVHRAFGERLAVLAGDALIVLAFQAVASEAGCDAERRVALLTTLASAAGMPHGIVAGQAQECEGAVALSQYQQAKTGALFAAATMAGAQAAGVDPGPWRRVGECIGEAYQVADDICDVSGDAEQLGKPTGRDAALGRPNAVGELGMGAARARLDALVGAALGAVPECPGAARLRASIVGVAEQLVAPRRARPAA